MRRADLHIVLHYFNEELLHEVLEPIPGRYQGTIEFLRSQKLYLNFRPPLTLHIVQGSTWQELVMERNFHYVHWQGHERKGFGTSVKSKPNHSKQHDVQRSLKGKGPCSTTLAQIMHYFQSFSLWDYFTHVNLTRCSVLHILMQALQCV